ncbi:MAG: hypothetical protein H0Z35_09325 [Thermoanaerobacteraceae bacterium]|nr:hypothetical protein [Thermoanaerobacteraceae bacterium]
MGFGKLTKLGGIFGKALGEKYGANRQQQESIKRVQNEYPRFTLAEKMGLKCTEETYVKLSQLEQLRWEEKKRRQ